MMRNNKKNGIRFYFYCCFVLLLVRSAAQPKRPWPNSLTPNQQMFSLAIRKEFSSTIPLFSSRSHLTS